MSHVNALMEQAGQRSRGYWLLSRLFLEVPTASRLAEVLGMLADDRLATSDEIVALRKEVEAALTEPEKAAAAFTRHLVLGDRASREPLPYEAHVLEGKLPGDSTAEVHAAMMAAGYMEVAPEAPLPDHIGAELRFMALLCHEEHRAWEQNDPAAAAGCLTVQKSFLNDHLAQWAPEYCRGLVGRTASPYLRAVANMTAASVDEDVVVVADICDWVAPGDLVGQSSSRHESPTIQ